MYNNNLEGNIIKFNDSAHRAFYMLSCHRLFKILLVVDKESKLCGVITKTDFGFEWNMSCFELDGRTAFDVCSKSFTSIPPSEGRYTLARDIFATKNIQNIPVVDDNGFPVDIISRWQALFLDYYKSGSLEIYQYARNIMDAAKLAKDNGYDRISVIEFGVAGGTRLLICELYAIEIEKLTGVAIDMYGFDLGNGLNLSNDTRDHHEWVHKDDFPMDIGLLQGRLRKAKLILGDICDTAKTFLGIHSPAPIGAMMIDVDQYAPTAAILEMLFEDDKYFLPIIYMYFDDIHPHLEFQGEQLAIVEFNAKSQDIKISPEKVFERPTMKTCKRFNHEKFKSWYDKNNNRPPQMIPLRF